MSNEAAMTSIKIPEYWALVMPCGCVDGLMRGSARHATTEATWKTFTPLKRNRDKEQRDGWTIRHASPADIKAHGEFGECPHGEATA